jgi:hypothetical protein
MFQSRRGSRQIDFNSLVERLQLPLTQEHLPIELAQPILDPLQFTLAFIDIALGALDGADLLDRPLSRILHLNLRSIQIGLRFRQLLVPRSHMLLPPVGLFGLQPVDESLHVGSRHAQGNAHLFAEVSQGLL